MTKCPKSPAVRLVTLCAVWLTMIACLCVAAWPVAAAPSDPGGGVTVAAVRKNPSTVHRIRDIRIEGVQRVEANTILSYMLVQPGDPFDADRFNLSQKTLYATGLFADVNLSRDGDTLIVKVVENPIINGIAFQGNSAISKEALAEALQLRPRAVYTRPLVESEVKRLLDLYRRTGRWLTTIEPVVTQLPENQVDLVFAIKEGGFTGVGRIDFAGNRHYGANVLRAVIRTKESRWYRTPRTYDPDNLDYDQELLRHFYLTAGYVDFRIVSATAELTPSRDNFIISFTVDEGERYRFGKIEAAIKVKDVFPAAVQPLLTTRSGDWYNAEQVGNTIKVVTDTLHNRGHQFVEVTPEFVRNSTDHMVDITFVVGEAPPVYVERMDIVGNVRTEDKVIRREFWLAEGDAFTPSRMKQSEQAIKNLGFFKNVGITANPGSAPNEVTITAEVEEQSTGEVVLGLSYELSKGLLANASVKERNLLGRGQAVTAKIEFSTEGTKSELSFADPYVLDRNIPGKWGFEFATGSAYDWTTLVAGFQLTMWAGVLVFRIPLVLLLLLQGAYYTSLWSHDRGRCRRQFERTMKACKAAILLQSTYVMIAHVIALLNVGIMSAIDV